MLGASHPISKSLCRKYPRSALPDVQTISVSNIALNRSTADIFIELYDDQRKNSHVASATIKSERIGIMRRFFQEKYDVEET